MRFSLIDLLLRVAATLLAVLGGQAVISRMGFPPSQVVLIAVTTLLVLGVELVVMAPLYRVMRFLPLHLPTCPHCGKAPSGYHVLGGEWPNAEVKCAACGGGAFLVFKRGAPLPASDPRLPVLVLQWPESVGIWRRA
jgi:hypothetical protein